MPKRLNGAELDRFLRGRHVAVLATYAADGTAVLTPIWYLYENGALLMRTAPESAKARNIRRNPKVSVCVQDERPPYKSVTIYGTAELRPEMPSLGQRMANHYLGRVAGAGYTRTARAEVEAAGGEATVVVKPERTTSQDFSLETPAYAQAWLLAKRVLPPQV